jgi:WD40 repeat protein
LRGNAARLWDAATGKQIEPALKHDKAVNGAVFSPDQHRILTWSDDRTARLWDAAAGKQIGPAPEHNEVVNGAVFSPDHYRILTWSGNAARLWDVRWAMRDATEADFVRDLCREKLVGASIPDKGSPSTAHVLASVHHIDASDTSAAPILRGREGEDVCGPAPTTLETLMSRLREAVGK